MGADPVIAESANRSGFFTESLFLVPGHQEGLQRIAVRSLQTHGVSATPTPAPWVSRALRALDELGDLETDWDGEGAPAIADETVRAALLFLAGSMRTSTSSPSVVPTLSGGVQLEWHQGGLDVEVEFDPTGTQRLGIRERTDPQAAWSGDPRSHFDRFLAVLERLDSPDGLSLWYRDP